MVSLARPAGFSVRGLLAAAMIFATVSMTLLHAVGKSEPFLPNGLIRTIFSLGAIAAVYAARRQTFLKQALYVLAVEAAGGILAFALIDVPFVEGHRAQIESFAVGAYERFNARSL